MFIDTNIMILLGHALDAALMREQAIANNIAHQKTTGYESLQVNFEQQFASIATQDLARLSAVRPVYQVFQGEHSIDNELALNVVNTTQFKALIKGVNYQLSLMKLALQG